MHNAEHRFRFHAIACERLVAWFQVKADALSSQLAHTTIEGPLPFAFCVATL
jgi:hypothetical protein